MADETMTKKVTDLTESTAPTDEDLFLVGSAGTASLRKIKWSNIWAKITSAILNKMVANNLITTAAGYLLDARQGKVLDGKISELNTKMEFSQTTISISGSNTPLTVTKIGRLVTVELYATTTGAIKGWSQLGTITEKYRPAKTIYANAIANNVTTGIYISTAGVFEFTTDISSGASLGFCITYVSAA